MHRKALAGPRKMNARLMAFVLILTSIAGDTCFSQEVGEKWMPRVDAVANKGEREVPWPMEMVPLKVTEVRQDEVSGGSDYWISRSHIIPMSEAEAYYAGVIKDHPFEAKAYHYRGIARRENGLWKTAFADFDQAIELAPDDADTWCDRGIAHYLLSEYEGALADFDKAIRVDSQSTRALMWRGEYWFGLDNFESAIADFSQVIRIDATVKRVFARRGCAFNRIGQYEKAVADFQEGVRMDPMDHYGNRMAAWFYISCKDRGHRNGEQAIRYATTYCELTDWKFPEALDFLACGYALNGEFEKAIEFTRKAIENGGDPGSFGAQIERFERGVYEAGQ